MKALSIILLSIILTACLVGPNYKPPSLLLPAEFKEAKNLEKSIEVSKEVSLLPPQNLKSGNGFLTLGWKIAEPCLLIDPGPWWQVFQEPQLDHLESQLNVANQNIANAVANYYQALALIDEARASFFPTLTGSFTMLRQKAVTGTVFTGNSGNTIISNAGTGGPSPIRTNVTALLTANWEPDLWGAVRRNVEAQVAAAQASEAQIFALRLSSQASLAEYYFELRTLDTDQELLDETAKAYAQILKFTLNQYKQGIVSRPAVLQAQMALETAQTQALNNGILRGQYEHAIAVLIGQIPSVFSLAKKPLKVKTPEIPVLVPSLWLERRPDVTAAERMMQEFNAQIGLAMTAYFPTLNLSASTNASASSLKQLFQAPAIGWVYGLQLAETFVDGGARAAMVKAAKAAYWAQVASYRQTVLNAFQEVEDNLVALRLLREQAQIEKRIVEQAKKNLRLTLNQYKVGTLAYNEVLNAKISAYAAEKTANDVFGLQMSISAALIKALGGTWELAEKG